MRGIATMLAASALTHAAGPMTRVRSTPKGGFSIAKLNRHTDKPHEHKREIARRLRQAERKGAK